MAREVAGDLGVQVCKHTVTELCGFGMVKVTSASGAVSAASHIAPAVACMEVTKEVVHPFRVQRG